MKKLLDFPSKFIKGFFDDDCYLWASALSFYTLLSIIPALAIVFGIAKGFGFEPALESEIRDIFYQQPLFAEKLIVYAKSTLENAHGSLIAGAGIILLFWTSIGLLGNFESALNKIWDIHKMRTLKEKITAYLPILIFGPIAIIASSSVTFVLISKIIDLSVQQGIYPALKPAITGVYYSILLVLTWLLFLFLYTYIPNKKMPMRSCLVASFFTALSFQLTQWAYIHLQIYLASYNAIYGSLAAIPLFLLWLQTAWLIILAGAELAKQYVFFRKNAPVPISERGLFLLSILLCCKAYQNKRPLLTPQKLSDKLSIDLLLAEQILNRLQANHLLIRTGDGAFIPASPTNRIMIDEVFAAVDDAKDSHFHVNDSHERIQVMETLSQWDLEQKSLPANTSLEKLLS